MFPQILLQPMTICTYYSIPGNSYLIRAASEDLLGPLKRYTALSVFLPLPKVLGLHDMSDRTVCYRAVGIIQRFISAARLCGGGTKPPPEGFMLCFF